MWEKLWQVDSLFQSALLVFYFSSVDFRMMQLLHLFFSFQAEMHRIEDEQTYEELKILCEIVHDKFHDLAEVRNILHAG